MNQPRKTHVSKLRRTLGKFFVSGLVWLSFAGYVGHERVSGADQTVLAGPRVVPTQTQTQSNPRAATAVPTLRRLPTSFRPPTAIPQVVVPTVTPENISVYRDGTFKG